MGESDSNQTQRTGFLLCLVSVLLGSCTLEIGKSSDAGEAAGNGSQPQGSAPCATADQLPEEERRAAADAGVAALTRAGKTLGDAWTEPATFQLFQQAAYGSVGCDLEGEAASSSGMIEQGLHADEGPDFYCGPGHGSARLTVPTVASCLNQACRTHDACYAQCSAPTSLTCMWGGPTATCDDSFMETIESCDDDSHKFASFLVRFLATALYLQPGPLTTSLACATGMTCPGLGPCLQEASSESCTHCLESRDVGGVCHERACEDDPVDITCYTANCPEVSGCFGGYNLPAPPVVVPPEETVSPDSQWSVAVLRAVIPDRKPNGDTWDADAGGFAQPDVRVGVRVDGGGLITWTPVIQDSLVPTWATPPLIGSATAAALQAGIEFTATDVDLAFHDAIGTCSTAAAVDASTVAPSCSRAQMPGEKRSLSISRCRGWTESLGLVGLAAERKRRS